jgi:hypothetical protein
MKPLYSWYMMAIKGFLIGLPAGGITLAALWPLSYWIGGRFKRNEVSELLSGASAGLSIVVFMVFCEYLGNL